MLVAAPGKKHGQPFRRVDVGGVVLQRFLVSFYDEVGQAAQLHQDREPCIALKQALARYGKPEIFNTDQGSRFTGFDVTGVLKRIRILCAWFRRGLLANPSIPRLAHGYRSVIFGFFTVD